MSEISTTGVDKSKCKTLNIRYSCYYINIINKIPVNTLLNTIKVSNIKPRNIKWLRHTIYNGYFLNNVFADNKSFSTAIIDGLFKGDYIYYDSISEKIKDYCSNLNNNDRNEIIYYLKEYIDQYLINDNRKLECIIAFVILSELRVLGNRRYLDIFSGWPFGKIETS